MWYPCFFNCLFLFISSYCSGLLMQVSNTFKTVTFKNSLSLVKLGQIECLMNRKELFIPFNTLRICCATREERLKATTIRNKREEMRERNEKTKGKKNSNNYPVHSCLTLTHYPTFAEKKTKIPIKHPTARLSLNHNLGAPA